MTSPLVTVLMGGPDGERPVSIESGHAVAAALIDAGWRVESLVIDKPDAAMIRSIPGDVFFPVLHGPWGEGGPLQELLSQDGRPFVGAGARAAAICMDKAAVKSIAESHGVSTPPWSLRTDCTPIPLEPPVVVKPNAEGSSLSLSLCNTTEEAAAAVAELIASRGCALVERMISGRELTVGVLDGTALPIIEIVPAATFYDYAAKYQRDDTRYVVDPDLPPTRSRHIQDAATTLCEVLGVGQLARVDFLLDTDDAWLLEVNTMPGFTSHSLLPMAAKAAGRSMSALCEQLVLTAVRTAAGPAS